MKESAKRIHEAPTGFKSTIGEKKATSRRSQEKRATRVAGTCHSASRGWRQSVRSVEGRRSVSTLERREAPTELDRTRQRLEAREEDGHRPHRRAATAPTHQDRFTRKLAHGTPFQLRDDASAVWWDCRSFQNGLPLFTTHGFLGAYSAFAWTARPSVTKTADGSSLTASSWLSDDLPPRQARGIK